MAKIYNAGNVNLDAVEASILSAGGGKSEKVNSDGSKHVSVYSTSENRHISYDVDADGNVSNVHTDKDNHSYIDYKSGR